MINKLVSFGSEVPVGASLTLVLLAAGLAAWVAWHYRPAVGAIGFAAVAIILPLTSLCWFTGNPGWQSAVAVAATTGLFVAGMAVDKAKKVDDLLHFGALAAALLAKPAAGLVGVVFEWLFSSRTFDAAARLPVVVWIILVAVTAAGMYLTVAGLLQLGRRRGKRHSRSTSEPPAQPPAPAGTTS